MDTHSLLIIVFGSLFLVVALAHLIAFRLARRSAPDDPVITNLNERIYAWWIILISVSAAFLFGKTGVILLFALCSFAALREFFTIAPTKRGDHMAIWLSFFLFLPLQYYMVYLEWYSMATVLIPVYAFLSLPVVAALRNDTTHYLERIADTQWGLMICVFSLSHVPMLLTLNIKSFSGKSILLAVFLLVVVQASDVLQYVWGKLCGRHKVAPNLSPSKTWEGLVGGIISASVLSALLSFITPFSWYEAALFGFIICLCGFFGGLVMSAIKRDRGIKDWGSSIEGHGGFLDRLDSVIFSAPVFFHLVRYFWT